MARAVIFDMNGVLVDSEPLHRQVTREVLGPAATARTEATALEFIGRPVRDMLETLIRRHGLPGRLADYETRYGVLLRNLLAQPRPPREGAVWLLAELRRGGCRLGLAWPSIRTWVDAMLASIGLSGQFDVLVTRDTVARSKPAPDVYLLAAERLGVPPRGVPRGGRRPRGARAARAAGMAVVALLSPNVEAARLGGAGRVVHSLRDFPFDLVDIRRITTAPLGPSSDAEPTHNRAPA